MLHFHYTTWPDFGVPSCPDTFLEFLGAVRESGSLESDKAGPAVVHCSAGIGRSSSFVLVDSCLLEAETAGPEAVNIKQRLLDMRTFRMGLIQTDDQLKFSYQAISSIFQFFSAFPFLLVRMQMTTGMRDIPSSDRPPTIRKPGV